MSNSFIVRLQKELLGPDISFWCVSLTSSLTLSRQCSSDSKGMSLAATSQIKARRQNFPNMWI